MTDQWLVGCVQRIQPDSRPSTAEVRQGHRSRARRPPERRVQDQLRRYNGSSCFLEIAVNVNVLFLLLLLVVLSVFSLVETKSY